MQDRHALGARHCENSTYFSRKGHLDAVRHQGNSYLTLATEHLGEHSQTLDAVGRAMHAQTRLLGEMEIYALPGGELNYFINKIRGMYWQIASAQSQCYTLYKNIVRFTKIESTFLCSCLCVE